MYRLPFQPLLPLAEGGHHQLALVEDHHSLQV
jgi:hypothetical protein